MNALKAVEAGLLTKGTLLRMYVSPKNSLIGKYGSVIMLLMEDPIYPCFNKVDVLDAGGSWTFYERGVCDIMVLSDRFSVEILDKRLTIKLLGKITKNLYKCCIDDKIYIFKGVLPYKVNSTITINGFISENRKLIISIE